MKTRCKTVGDQTYFIVEDADPAYHETLTSLYFTPFEGGFARSFPAESPFIDRAYDNFARTAEAFLQQRMGIVTYPWQDTLQTFIGLVDGHNLDWMVVGSAAMALYGLDVQPGDVDLVTGEDDALKIAALALDYIIQPVQDTTGWISKWFARAMMGGCLEWAGGVNDNADQPEPGDFGPTAVRRAQTVIWRGHAVRVPPLDLLLAVNRRRGRLDRAALIEAAMKVSQP